MSKLLSDLGVNPLIQQALIELNITEATDIEEQVIPMVLQQKEDIVALAKTGTGKTAAFGLPLIQKVEVNNDRVQSLILSPTRELSQQISNSLMNFVKNLPKEKITLLTGEEQLKRK